MSADSRIANITEVMKDAFPDLTDTAPHVDQMRDIANAILNERTHLPDAYWKAIGDPYLKNYSRGTVPSDFGDAIIQYQHFKPSQTKAFEEIVSDLYDAFGAERISAPGGSPPPKYGGLPPLVRWGNPTFGPYTYTISEGLWRLNFRATTVSLPPYLADRGLIAYTALGHETAGHDILHSYDHLMAELANAVAKALLAGGFDQSVAEYFQYCLDETASDVMGLLHVGPAAGIGLPVYFHAIRKGAPLGSNTSIGPNEQTNEDEADTHPIDILRAYLAASVIRNVFTYNPAEQEVWGKTIEQIADKDVKLPIHYAYNVGSSNWSVGQVVKGQFKDLDQAKKAAGIVGKAIATTKVQSLGNLALTDLRNWTAKDESLVTILRARLNADGPINIQIDGEAPEGFAAPYVVAAAALEALAAPPNQNKVKFYFKRLTEALEAMHSFNKRFASPVGAPNRHWKSLQNVSIVDKPIIRRAHRDFS